MTNTTQHHGVLWRLWDEIHFSLCKLNEIQFSAPWRTGRPTC